MLFFWRKASRFLFEVLQEQNGVVFIAYNSKAEAVAYVKARNESKLDHEPAHQVARKVKERRERAKLNRAARTDAMKSVGMTKTKYGWE